MPMSGRYKIGFANLSEVEEYSVIVRENLESLAAQDDAIELIVRDNDHNDDKALANVNEFVEKGVDLAIVYHINEHLGGQIRSILRTIPLIAVDIPIPLSIYVGIDNTQMGTMAAEVLLDWTKQKWGQLDKLLALVDSRVLGQVRERVTQATDRIEQEAIIAKGNTLFLDSRYTLEENYTNLYEALRNWDEFNKIAIVAYNDQTSLNALQVVQDLNMEHKVVIVGHAASDIVIDKIKAQTPLIASTLSYPEEYGTILLDVAKRMLNGEQTPTRNHVPLGMLKSPAI
jgi:ABC-type sugar transport system substrate-binding protein